VQTTIVIQCGADKRGAYLRTADGDRVEFCAQPRLGSFSPGRIYARPDDPAAPSGTWRSILSAYNESFTRTGENPDNLSSAWQLYVNVAYRSLAEAFGTKNIYILPAGWGLVHALSLPPNYNITFSGQADPIAIRRKGDVYHDAMQMPDDISGPVLFLRGLSYLPMFLRLTNDVQAERIVYYSSIRRPDTPGARLVRYETNARTNWHYQCAHDLASGQLAVR
jgi:hypothetical protein